jgi:hypothetical protein
MSMIGAFVYATDAEICELHAAPEGSGRGRRVRPERQTGAAGTAALPRMTGS